MRVGIDVGGEKKGFHVAVLRPGSLSVDALFHARSPEEVVAFLTGEAPEPEVIAIDCPPAALRRGDETRKAERELHARGYRVQWTRQADPAEWMVNGARLWQELRLAFPRTELIETFPTAVSRESLGSCPLSLPLGLLAPFGRERGWKDWVDACLCADVARRWPEAACVGTDDELGPIWF